jgi:transposase
LLWESDVSPIYHKRLEKVTFEGPVANSQLATVFLEAKQLLFILQGVSLRKVFYRFRFP